MDWGALITAAIIFVVGVFIVIAAGGEWQRPAYISVRDWASYELEGNSSHVSYPVWVYNLGGMVVAAIWIGLAEIISRQWTIVIIFASLYSLGYASGALVACGTVMSHMRKLKQPPKTIDRTLSFNYWVFWLTLALTLLSLAATIGVTVFKPTFTRILTTTTFTLGGSSRTIEVSGYSILAIVGICSTILLQIRMFVVRRRALNTLIKGIDDEGPDDDVVRAEIIQRLNTGEEVKRDQFPTVDRDRLQGIFYGIAKGLSEATQVDRVNLTMSLHNAAAVQSVHNAFEAVRTATSEPQRRDASHELASALLRELGLPAPIASPQSTNPVFTMSIATPGALAAVLPERFPVLVTALDESGIRVHDVSLALETALTQATTKSRFGIAIAAHNSQLLRTVLTQPDAGGLPQHVVYLDEDRIRAVLATRLPDIRAAFMAQVRSSVDISIVAPFITKGPTTDLMFVGRTKEIGAILQDVETRSYAILGGRRIGKTSMLHQVMLRLEQRGYATLDMDCSVAIDYAAFANLMQLHWEGELGDTAQYLPAPPADDLPITFQRLVAALTASRFEGKRLVFMFDEVDLLLFADMSRQTPEQLFRGFRILSQTGKCQFIFSGERRIYEQFRNPASPMFNFCMPIRPGLLTLDEAYKLVEDPFALLNIELVQGREVSNRVADACSCHPNLIQWVCAEIIKSLDPADIQPKISLQLVSGIVERPQFRREYIDAFWGQATALEKAITVLVTNDGVTRLEELLIGVHQAGFAITEDEFRTAIEYLELYCILERTNDGVSLLARHFPEYIAAEIIDRDTYLREKSAEHARG